MLLSSQVGACASLSTLRLLAVLFEVAEHAGSAAARAQHMRGRRLTLTDSAAVSCVLSLVDLLGEVNVS